ncbi:Fe-S cluster protein [Candidatus Bipolaricaulota bacterium]|nr:Fe-S cluster protein [Candidatus Bipolaricaulota bacterium]
MRIRVSYPPCHPGGAEWVRAEAELTDDVSPVFPYLNAIMKGTVYDPKGKALTFTLGGRGITLRPKSALVTRLKDREEAEEVLERLRTLINRTWERRGEIEPSYKTRAKLTPLSIYRNLPKTNCGRCGEPTCMAFALKLVGEGANIRRCGPLFEAEYAKEREELLRLLSEAGYET